MRRGGCPLPFVFAAAVALVFIAGAPLLARADNAQALAAARAALQDGVSRADADGILRARAAFLALQPEATDAPAIACWVALCCWRAEPLIVEKDRDRARRLCRDGIAACDLALAGDPRFGEALALRASLQALSLTFVPSATMSLGPEMQEEFTRAAGMDPENPRVQFLFALFILHKPAQYAGGPRRAQPMFERALARFGDAPGRHGMTWGRDDALLWSGRCLAQLGDWPGARARLRAAVVANPDNAWVRDALLPEAERHLAAPADSR